MVATKPRMTEEEFMRLPANGRKYELVDGEPKEVPTGMRHDYIVMWLGYLLMPFAEGRGILVSSNAGYRMANRNIRCPDVGFMRDERLPDGEVPVGFGDSAPDLCIEIISPSEDMRDATRKVGEYFDSGAKEVWHMFPDDKTLRVYHSTDDARAYAPEDEVETPDLLPGFRARVADLFGNR